MIIPKSGKLIFVECPCDDKTYLFLVQFVEKIDGAEGLILFPLLHKTHSWFYSEARKSYFLAEKCWKYIEKGV